MLWFEIYTVPILQEMQNIKHLFTMRTLIDLITYAKCFENLLKNQQK